MLSSYVTELERSEFLTIKSIKLMRIIKENHTILVQYGTSRKFGKKNDKFSRRKVTGTHTSVPILRSKNLVTKTHQNQQQNRTKYLILEVSMVHMNSRTCTELPV